MCGSATTRVGLSNVSKHLHRPWLYSFSPAAPHSNWLWQSELNETLFPHSSYAASKLIMVTFTILLLFFLFRLKTIFQCQTGLSTFSLHGTDWVKSEPFVCFQIDPFLWQTTLDGTWLFNLGNAAATYERVYGSVWQTAERPLGATAGSCFLFDRHCGAAGSRMVLRRYRHVYVASWATHNGSRSSKSLCEWNGLKNTHKWKVRNSIIVSCQLLWQYV